MSARSLRAAGLHPVGALSLMILEDGPLFIADTHVHPEPTPEQIMRHRDRRGPACAPLWR